MAAPIDKQIGVCACVAVLLAAELDKEEEEERRREAEVERGNSRRFWVRPWLMRRAEHGAYNALLQELISEDAASLQNFLRMDVERFYKVLEVVGPLIKRKDTFMRKAIAPGERLAITLRFLATGNRFRHLQYLYRVSYCTISRIVIDTCRAIIAALKRKYLKAPQQEEEWNMIAQGYNDKWDFPNCLGALDGKHIAIEAPSGEGSAYFNYKHHHSIILLALVDSAYKFIYVDVGANGRAGDAGVFRNSALFEALEGNSLGTPAPKPLRGQQDASPHVIVGDDAFPLKNYLLKPYPHRMEEELNSDEAVQKRIFNYRLSRARRCSENAFGILVQRFGVFRSAMALKPEKATVVTEAALCLHNFLLTECDRAYRSGDTEASVTRTRQSAGQLTPIASQSGNRNGAEARRVRDNYKAYFNSEEGATPWQYKFI